MKLKELNIIVNKVDDDMKSSVKEQFLANSASSYASLVVNNNDIIIMEGVEDRKIKGQDRKVLKIAVVSGETVKRQFVVPNGLQSFCVVIDSDGNASPVEDSFSNEQILDDLLEGKALKLTVKTAKAFNGRPIWTPEDRSENGTPTPQPAFDNAKMFTWAGKIYKYRPGKYISNAVVEPVES